ncbi:MAG: SAM-dependent methyltransferase, partial [Gemmatimonadota bacterium]|nr:SAM-dependent methyltransferase [Gemmatimonadota bacterium]
VHAGPLFVRGGVAVILLAPVATAMGMLFPLGLRGIAGDRAGIAWAWAANGFASVVGVPLAALIAVEAGSSVLFLIAALAYAGASLIPPGEASP